MHFNSLERKKALEKISKCLIQAEIDISQMQGSHFCFRPSTYEKYQEFKAFLAQFEFIDKLSEEMSVGRPITWYEFKSNIPLLLGTHSFPYLEVPSPKEVHNYSVGITHAAFTVKEISLGVLMLAYPNLEWITDKLNDFGIVELHFSDFQLKFHSQTVPEMLGIHV
jgi:predicted metalloenzyme YecM